MLASQNEATLTGLTTLTGLGRPHILRPSLQNGASITEIKGPYKMMLASKNQGGLTERSQPHNKETSDLIFIAKSIIIFLSQKQQETVCLSQHLELHIMMQENGNKKMGSEAAKQCLDTNKAIFSLK